MARRNAFLGGPKYTYELAVLALNYSNIVEVVMQDARDIANKENSPRTDVAHVTRAMTNHFERAQKKAA
jgi:hypothetical protein